MNIIPKQPRAKPSGKFSLPGMGVTLLGSVSAAILTGLVFYGLSLILSFSLPLVFPAIMGGLAGYAALRLGSTIGRCRNPMLAVSVAVLAGTVAWGTAHVVDYFQFRREAYQEIVREAPLASPNQINGAIDNWLKEQTGLGGFLGFMLIKATSNTLEITHVTAGGAALPPLTLNGFGLMFYWLFELMVAAGVAGAINWNYAKAPYCEKCNVQRKYKTPIAGTDANLEETISHLQQRTIVAALASLEKNPEGNVARLEVEFCPVCFDSDLCKLVVVKDTGPRTWLEKTVWADKLESDHIRKIIESAH